MDEQRAGRDLHRYRSKVAKLSKALREIAAVEPAQGNTLAWNMVLTAREALGKPSPSVNEQGGSGK